MCLHTNDLVRTKLKISATPQYKILATRRCILCVVEGCGKYPASKADMCLSHLHACECIVEECDGISTHKSRMCDEHRQSYRKCSKCQEILLLTEFQPHNRTRYKKDGTAYVDNTYMSACIICTKERQSKISGEDRYANKNPFTVLINNAKTADSQKQSECDLTLNYVVNLYVIQGEKCYYCKNKLTLAIGDKTLSQISIDRVNRDVNHIIGNCVVSCLFCNYAKNGATLEDYLNFLQVLRNFSTFETIKGGYAGIPNELSMYSSIRARALRCDSNKLANPNVMTNEEIRQLMIDQGGKCAITGIPFLNLRIPYFPFKMSLDRIDNDNKNHSKDNCQLVCLAIQFGRNDKTIEEIKNYLEIIKHIQI